MMKLGAFLLIEALLIDNVFVDKVGVSAINNIF